MKYTVEDVKRIVEFAMSRGVRVVPEIDSPGKPSVWAYSPLCFPASFLCFVGFAFDGPASRVLVH